MSDNWYVVPASYALRGMGRRTASHVAALPRMKLYLAPRPETTAPPKVTRGRRPKKASHT